MNITQTIISPSVASWPHCFFPVSSDADFCNGYYLRVYSGFVGTGQDKMVIGFIVEGAGNQQFILFGVGPTSGDFGLNGVLQNPKITLFNNATGSIIDSNDNWKEHPSSALVNEFMKETGMTLDDRESAMVLELPEGSYTLEVEGVGGTTGTGLGVCKKRI